MTHFTFEEELQKKSYLTTRDLSKWFGVTRQGIASWRNQSKDPLPYYRFGVHIRFTYWDVRSWMERRRVSKGVIR